MFLKKYKKAVIVVTNVVGRLGIWYFSSPLQFTWCPPDSPLKNHAPVFLSISLVSKHIRHKYIGVLAYFELTLIIHFEHTALWHWWQIIRLDVKILKAVPQNRQLFGPKSTTLCFICSTRSTNFPILSLSVDSMSSFLRITCRIASCSAGSNGLLFVFLQLHPVFSSALKDNCLSLGHTNLLSSSLLK